MTVLKNDMVGPGDGFSYNSDNEQVTVNPGVVVGSTGSKSGIDSGNNQDSLDNFGTVFSQGGTGVMFTGASASITNEVDAVITGGTFGLSIDSNGGTIENFGSIFGGNLSSLGVGVFFDANSNHVQLVNSGSIAGQHSGVVLQSNLDGGTIHNYGSISGGNAGIDVENHSSGLVTQVTNAKGATITGLDAIFVGGQGNINLNLVNAGTLNGALACENPFATDTIVNSGKINGNVFLDGMFDSFNGKKGSSGDIFTGHGHDTVLIGKGKTSVHIDDAGNSTLTGGAGHDKFIFDDGLGGGNVLIKHFSAGIDHIALSESLFHGLGPLGTLHAAHFGIDGNAHNALPQIVYNDHTGALYYDSNGDLPGGMIHFATLAGHPPIGHATFMLEA